VCSKDPAWKLLISHTLATHERISLITAIFSDNDQVDMVENLSGDDAQNFIDVVDEVSTCTLSPLRDRSIDSHQNLHLVN
jgi:hypothetical protein